MLHDAGCTVLLVEDEAVIAMDIRRQLESVGAAVVACVSKSADVIPAVQQHRPTIVLMDVRLRGDVDGVTLAEEIFVCEDVPVVFLSAFGDPGIYQRAGCAGAYGYLTKPVRQAALVATLSMAIQKHRDLRRRRDDAQWLGVMLNALNEAIVGLDADHRVRFMNHAAVQLTGWLLIDAKGEHSPWSEQLAALDASTGRGVAVSLLTRNEQPLPVLVKKLPVNGGGCVCVIEPTSDLPAKTL